MRCHGLLLAAALTLGLGACGPETPPPESPAQEGRGADEAERDATFSVRDWSAESDLRLRLREDGTYTLTALSAGHAEGDPLEAGQLAGAPADIRAGFADLADAFGRATADPRTRQPDHSSDLQLEIAADPLVPWRRVQFVLLAGASPQNQIFKVVFRPDPPALPVRVLQPKDRSCCPGTRAIRLELRVKLKRTHVQAEPSAFTRVELGAAYVEYDEGYMSPSLEAFEAQQTSGAQRKRIGTLDLPTDAASDEEHRHAWQHVEDVLRSRVLVGDRPVGIVISPQPSGAGVPYRDVVTAMLVLRRLGADPLQLHGPFPIPGAEDR